MVGMFLSVSWMNYISLVDRCTSMGTHPIVFLLYYLLIRPSKDLFIKPHQDSFTMMSLLKTKSQNGKKVKFSFEVENTIKLYSGSKNIL